MATKTPDSKNNLYFDQGRIETLVEILSNRYDLLLEALGISLSKTSKMYIGCCPIHGGNNPSAMNIYKDGYAVKGYWKCRTHSCEKTFKKTLIGFVRGVLSHQKLGWNNPEQTKKVYPFKDTIDWICKFVGQELKDVKVNDEEIANKKFTTQINSFVKEEKKDDKGITRDKVRAGLLIPAKLFLDKGYSKKVLDDYDIGLCLKPNKEMSDRVVAPIYDADKKFMVACTGRSIHPKCEKCKLYHSNKMDCPTNDIYKELKYSKWRNSSNSSVNSYLYNYWSAKKFIKETGIIILVEGPADVWMLEQLGIRNSVALFGVDLSDEQQVIIEMSGALNVVILLDMDEAGRNASKEIRTRLERSYRVFIPEVSVNDPGDFTPDIVKGELEPLLQGIKR